MFLYKNVKIYLGISEPRWPRLSSFSFFPLCPSSSLSTNGPEKIHISCCFLAINAQTGLFLPTCGVLILLPVGTGVACTYPVNSGK